MNILFTHLKKVIIGFKVGCFEKQSLAITAIKSIGSKQRI